MKKFRGVIIAALCLVLAAGAALAAAKYQRAKGAEVNPASGKQGLRLVAEFDTETKYSAYGVVIGWEGQTDPANLEIGDDDTVCCEQDYLDDAAKGLLYVTVKDFPAEKYNKDFTFITYTRDGAGTVTYGSTVKTVNLAESAFIQYYTGTSASGSIDYSGSDAKAYLRTLMPYAAGDALVVHPNGDYVFYDDININDISYSSSDVIYFPPADYSEMTGHSLSEVARPGLNLVAGLYKAELENSLGSLSAAQRSAITANYYTMGGSTTGLISEYIPSFESKCMTDFEVHGGQLVNVGLETVAGVETATKLVSLATYESLAKDFYEAVINTALSYDYQGVQIQYDQYNLRRNVNAKANEACADKDIYLDCSSFVNAVYYNAFTDASGYKNNLSVATSTLSFMTDLKNYAFTSDNEYVSYYKRTSSILDCWEGGVGEKTSHDGAEVISELKATLQPGDLLVYRHGTSADTSGGHVYMYLGDGRFIHCTGYSIESGASASTVEGYSTINHDNTKEYADALTGETYVGAIHILDSSYIFDSSTLVYSPENMNTHRRYILYDGSKMNNGTAYSSYQVWEIGVIRPLANKSRFYQLSAEGNAAYQYPGLTIEKSIKDASGNNAYYRSVAAGSELTVTLTVRNDGSRVLENIAVTDGSYETTVDRLMPGTEVKLSHKLTVNGTAGDFITVQPAVAGGISSNKVYYVVGSRDAGFASALTDSIGTQASVPSSNVQEALTNLYGRLSIDVTYKFGSLPTEQDYPNRKWTNEVPVLGNLFGGTVLNHSSDSSGSGPDFVRRVRKEYLEPGDIIVTADISMYTGTILNAFIYVSDSEVYVLNEGNGFHPTLYEFATADGISGLLTSLYFTEGFFVCRPGLK